jgi:ketosteroid isomerase-like protein
MDEINDPATVAELTGLAWRYERALVNNDIPTLEKLFWDSPHVVRLGATENLYGADEIRAFRFARPTANLARTVSNLRAVTFGADTGVVTLEFVRVVDGAPRYGRQTQVWRKFADGGWKVVSAHVSILPGEPQMAPPPEM